MLNSSDSNMAANAICHATEMVKRSYQDAAYEASRPSVIFRPNLIRDKVDGRWCANYGDCRGFGDSPAEAMYQFDLAWTRKTGE